MSRRKKIGEILHEKPPSDLDAERAVIGSILLDPSVRERISLTPKDFHSPAHSTVFACMCGMETVDAILLIDRLRSSGELKDVGGAAYLYEITTAVPVAHHAEHYARIVKELSRKREFIRLNCEALKAMYSGRWSVEKLRDRLIERLKEI